MPSTVNGIGTHYYGRSNVSVRTAVCKSCNRVGSLQSYDTRLWFVVVFIPIIPLGRKRILDQCPACTRHYAVKADVYEQSKQLQTSASLERFRREPTIATAIEAHGQLLAFHERDQAAEFRETALARFPDHAELRAMMARQIWEMSTLGEAVDLYRSALSLDPDLSEARLGVAQWNMAHGELDEARDLLDFLMEPGASQQHSLSPLDTLAGHFQKVGRHEDTLRITEFLLRENPGRAGDYNFRSLVTRSEKAIGRLESILPERKASLMGLFRAQGSLFAPWQRRLAIGTLVVVLILGGLAFNNEYIRSHRRLHVLNATGQVAQVQVDDQPAVPVNALGSLTVAEGPHVVKVTGPVNETRNFDLETGYFDRWTSQPVWLLNVGGEGVLEEVKHIYSVNGNVPSQRRLLVGETFYHRPHVDYVFTDAPQNMDLKHKNEELVKTSIGWTQTEDLQAFGETSQTNRKAAIEFAEKKLRRNPKQLELLHYFVRQSPENERPEIEAFLKSELDRRPVEVDWHREYQALAELANHKGELISLYDKFLAADPSNAALLYLRGRIDSDWEKQESLYRRAITSDAKLGWPWMALAAQADAEGRWDDALNAAQKARSLGNNEPERLAMLIFNAKVAKGEANSLVEEYRSHTTGPTPDYAAIFSYVELLAASGRSAEIDSRISALTMQLPNTIQPQLTPHLKAWALYCAGKLDECVKFCTTNPALKATPYNLHALLALGRGKDAADDNAFGQLWNDSQNLLAMSVGFLLTGNREESARWREKAVDAWSKAAGPTDSANVSTLLSAPEPPPIKDVQRTYISPGYKALVLVALADRFPAKRETYLNEAARYNIGRRPSYYLVKKVADTKATPAKP